jgi:hypothetical protein
VATLGEAINRKTREEEILTLSSVEREQSTYIIGTTGTGKTTLLRNIAVEDLWSLSHDGLCVLDPHGDFTDELLGWVPPSRIQDVVYLDPLDTDRPFGLNLLACDRGNEHEVRWVVSTIMETLYRLFFYSWGPRLEHVLHHTIRTAMAVPDSTFVELLLLLTSREYRDEVVGVSADEPGLLDPQKDYLLIKFWHDWFFKLSSPTRADVVSSVINKLSPFLLDSMMRNIIGQAESSVDIRAIMDEGKILLVNLSKGDIGENNSALLGSVLVNLVLIAALRRRGPQYAQGRRPFHLIVDEYQNFANRSFAILQSEARKFAVDLIVAHQYRDQLDQESQGASLNVGNIICFRVSGRDAYLLASQFDNTPPPAEVRMEPVWVPHDTTDQYDLYVPYVSPKGEKVHEPREQPRRLYSDVEAQMANNLSTLNNFQAYCRLIRRPIQGNPFLGEYKVTTLAQPQVEGQWSDATRMTCIANSRQRYGRERGAVEEAIYQRTGGKIETTIPASRLVDVE